MGRGPVDGLMFVQMNDLREWSLGQFIATGGGGARLATQAVGAGVGRGPVPLSTLQRQSLQRQQDLYLSPVERQRREQEEIRRQQAAQRATYGSQVRETAGSRAAAGTPVDAEVLRQQHAQRDEMTKRGVSVKDTVGSEAAAWGPTRVRTPPPPPAPAPPPPAPPTGPRPAPDFTPDYLTTFVNTPSRPSTGRSSWETSDDWLRQNDPTAYERRVQAERAQREAERRVAQRQARARQPQPKPSPARPTPSQPKPPPSQPTPAQPESARPWAQGLPSRGALVDSIRWFFGLPRKGAREEGMWSL